MSGLGHSNLLITLFGPGNETLIGELNMTGMTLPRLDIRSSGDYTGAAAAASPLDSPLRSGGYDSRGAAYYICIVILVYALAIVAFVVSMARRRNARDKYRLAHDQIVDCQQTEERRKGGCWKQRSSDFSKFPGMVSSLWSASSSSSSSSSNSGVAAHQRSDELSEHPRTADATDLTPSKVSVQLDPDEIITLVQVLPYSCNAITTTPTSTSECSKPSDVGVGAPYCEDDATTCPGKELETGQQQKRFRWSMGPDGNIWILQVDDAVVIDSTKNNDDRTSSNNDLGCPSQLEMDPAGPSQSLKDIPLVQSCSSSANAERDPLHSSGAYAAKQAKVDQRRPKNLAFSPVPKGYRPRGRSACNRERKARPLHTEEQGPKTTFPKGSYHCSSATENTVNVSLLPARDHHWEEYHFLDPEPFCLPSLLSPHLVQKLIHVTSV